MSAELGMGKHSQWLFPGRPELWLLIHPVWISSHGTLKDSQGRLFESQQNDIKNKCSTSPLLRVYLLENRILCHQVLSVSVFEGNVTFCITHSYDFLPLLHPIPQSYDFVPHIFPVSCTATTFYLAYFLARVFDTQSKFLLTPSLHSKNIFLRWLGDDVSHFVVHSWALKQHWNSITL